jgi:hypothetical protein
VHQQPIHPTALDQLLEPIWVPLELLGVCEHHYAS